MTNEFDLNYVSARSIPELVGREQILKLIDDAIADPSDRTYVFYITAPGGWGKTRLLEHVLKRSAKIEETNIVASDRLVDLYHTYTHSEEGLIADLVEAIDPDRLYFENYRQQRAELNRVKYDLAEILRAVTQQRTHMMDAFQEDFHQLGAEHKIVLGIDTVENLVYETDRVQEALGLAEEPIGVTGWLVKRFLPNIRRAVVLIAGRPESPQLEDELLRIPEIEVIRYKKGTVAGSRQALDLIHGV